MNCSSQLIVRFNSIDRKILITSGLVTKSQYESYKNVLEKKIEDKNKKTPNIIWLDKKIGYNAKIT